MQLRRFGTTKLMVIGGLICVVSPAFPQQSQSQPDPKEINLVAGNLASQRNDAQNNVAVLQAKLALAEEKIKELELKLKEKETEKEPKK